METVVVFILSVAAIAGSPRPIQIPPPHKYYPTMGVCHKAGEQWEKVVNLTNTTSSGRQAIDLYAKYSCSEQTILVPKR